MLLPPFQLLNRNVAFVTAVLICLAASLQADDEKQPTAQDIEFFERKIRPVLANRCYECHSKNAKSVRGGLTVDSLEGLLQGGDSGPAIVKGKPQESLLIQSIHFSADADFQMPPKGKISDKEINVLTEWIRNGAPFPGDNRAKAKDKKIDFPTARKFWSFQTAELRTLPKNKLTNWPKQRIDHFVLQKMEEKELLPAKEADKATLLRRVTLDLIGLPTTPDELNSFVNDTSPNAYEKVIDRLLRSPHYGERWARVWLDLARYTDRNASWLTTTGQAHLYRDWVVKAMNEDMPYDEFIKRQLATDYLPTTKPDDLPALGFIGLSPNYWKELKLPAEIIKVIVADEWEERIDAVSRTFLGLTVACARCHDHKFDAITMEDYYAMAGVFASCRIEERPTISVELYEPVRKAKSEIGRLETKIKELQKKKPIPGTEIEKLKTNLAELKKTPHLDTPMAIGVVDESLYVQQKGANPQQGTKLVYKPHAQNLNLFIRGNPNRLGKEIPRRFLTVLSETNEPKLFKTGSGRLDLANAITTDAASLTARVFVNRIWLAHFGRGIVTTPSNFGESGSRPSHPELLDDLAARFVANGWSLKQLHKEILMSATYRQSTQASKMALQKDPANIWLSRMSRTRLSVEAWRDSMLSVSGKLDRKVGGPSVNLSDLKNYRRTLYGTIHRREMSTMLLNHDFPDPTAHSPQRVPTTTTLQGLYALNGPFVLSQAEALATRLLDTNMNSDSERIQFAYQLLFARAPTESEQKLALEFLNPQSGSPQSALPKKVAWTQYAQVLLASNEFLFAN